MEFVIVVTCTGPGYYAEAMLPASPGRPVREVHAHEDTPRQALLALTAQLDALGELGE